MLLSSSWRLGPVHGWGEDGYPLIIVASKLGKIKDLKKKKKNPFISRKNKK